MGKAILNYTTTIAADKTAMECVGLLAGHGATKVGMTFGEARQPDGLEFIIDTPFGPRGYELPVNIAGTAKALQAAYQRGRAERKHTTPEQARRVAWRIMKDWIEVQVALIEAGMVDLTQVMLPYLRVEEGKTLYSAWLDSERKAIGR